MKKLVLLNGFLAATALVAAAVIFLVPGSEPAYAAQAGTVAQDGKGGVMIVGTAGDLQQVDNLIYVVHKRPLTEREASFIRKIDSNFPDERITLTVYRFNAGGASGANGSPAVLHYMRDITWDHMILGSTQKVHDECMEHKKWVDNAVKAIKDAAKPPPPR